MHKSEKRRKRIVLTLEDKLSVIQDRQSGKSVDSIAECYNIGASTVSEIWKRRNDIEQAVQKNKLNGLGNRKTLKDPMKPLVENELFNWYLEQKEQDIRLTQNEFIEKAKEIDAQLNENITEGEEFSFTKGWLTRFKNRYGITSDSKSPEVKQTWHSALEAAEYLLDYINARNEDFLLKDVITVRMIRDKIANENEIQNSDF